MPNASGRRYKQALQGFKNFSPQRRPHYKKRSAENAAAHNERIRARDIERRARGYKGR